MQPLIVDKTLESMRKAIESSLNEDDSNAYTRHVLANYWETGVPLSSNRIIHDLLIILRNVTARVITLSKPNNGKSTDTFDSKKLYRTTNIEAAWSDLMKKVAEGIRPQDNQLTEVDKKLNKNLRGIK
ncbi:hypothetical protein BDF20DRAFT_672088 [Mycotypha africana]|uniref:uncharacterized protein n=1 Tax=Mycotypha africana TaxID=64632 RepID=UPI0023011906|nr:uncharacterized protein BDF20DRAFT_672088 [Mycotypha africana]KAI8973784.1 hypothetical protein BDF20DRAFT_672088 [Mycotypha africana]